MNIVMFILSALKWPVAFRKNAYVVSTDRKDPNPREKSYNVGH